ncbi:uncharacterized protein GGS22DRAFT_69641 [Annulohypoxylon maeteangense]|uniref:uncharacterized protein n=1 Tax=Annulohypoxylon maeteangense TaxID=1927788 RepID=UPI0020089EA6|nr:uncharacterized protein GGS22DRAFT_69641 [Annulohypoxylon maeteangense]KAI0889296.1 hypothetical protein GGS22DRAFT_69641 [Annulohypoxylon maeteangense]
MRFLSLLSLLCLGALQPALAALNLTGVPACGLTCLASEVGKSDCTFTNATCICTNPVLLANITECVTASCSIRDQLSTKKFSAETCGIPGEDRTALIKIIAIVFGALGLLAFILRCMARFIGPHDWGHDDSVMCLVMALEIAFVCLSVPISKAGLGLDMWFVPHDSITQILKLYFFDELLYITALALTKISILFFYLKVFPKRSFRICAWALITCNLVYALTYDFLLIFQCNPISGAWTFWDGETESKCISINILGWSAAAINIALDLAVIVLPLPALFGLSLSLRKRLQIIAMFAVGFFITVVSIIRLYTLIHFGDTQNLTQDYVETGYWSTIEVPVGIICACMPAVRSLFSRALPKIFGTTRNMGSTLNYGPSSANRLGPDSRNKISVKQEWSVLSEGPNDYKRSERDSSLELLTVAGLGGGADRKEMGMEVEVGVAISDHIPTRKMTLSKHDGTWRGVTVTDQEESSYKSAAYTTERELR